MIRPRFLLDSHIPLSVVLALQTLRPGCSVDHLAQWNAGAFRNAPDEAILLETLHAGLVFVTQDVGTVPALLHRWLAEGRRVLSRG